MFSSDDKIKKEEEKLKESQKVFGYVFDNTTLLNIYKFFHNGYLERFEFPIASGKESIVFAASKGNKFYAVKIYKVTASNFKNIREYAASRWGIGKISSKRKLMNEWAFREFENLKNAYEAGVAVPRPIKAYGNVVQMQYIGTRTRPAIQLKDIVPGQQIVEQIIGDIRKLYLKSKLVHGDISEYNFLYYRGKAYMIDIAQAISTDDPYSLILLKRDLNNIIRFLNKFGYSLNIDSVIKYVKGEIDAFR
ncbi:MAG: RIO1 family regulatory kinase/ATPase [Thermoplasmatales archaeon]